MNREELEKEAEEKIAQYMSEHTEKYNCENTKLKTDNYNTGREYGYRDGYLAAAESRETRIEQFEKENTELREKLEDTEKTRDYWKNSSFDRMAELLSAAENRLCTTSSYRNSEPFVEAVGKLISKHASIIHYLL